MKFTCTKENLVRGLGKVAAIAGRNKQLPILENVLLSLTDGVLSLVCTDLELGVKSVVTGKVDTNGTCAVAAKKLYEYAQQLPAIHPIVIELKKNSLNITTAGYQAKFPVMNTDDFPLLPTMAESTNITVSGVEFCQALNRVIFAAARDEVRPEIHSVYIDGAKESIVIAATDSYRLAEEKIITKSNNEDPFHFLLPLLSAQEFVRLFANEEVITLRPQNNHILVSGNGVELSSRLVDGSYPDYKQIIPQSSLLNGTVVKESLIRALKTLLVFLPRDSKRVKLQIKPTQSVILLAVTGGDSGAGDVSVAFDGEGEDLEVVFNIQYLLDGLQRMPGERTRVKFVGSTDPAVFLPDEESCHYTYVVMPIQSQ